MARSCLGAVGRTCFKTQEERSSFCFNRYIRCSRRKRRAVHEGPLTLSIHRDDVRLSSLAASGLQSLPRVAPPPDEHLLRRLAIPSNTALLIEEVLLRDTIEGTLHMGALEYAC